MTQLPKQTNVLRMETVCIKPPLALIPSVRAVELAPGWKDERPLLEENIIAISPPSTPLFLALHPLYMGIAMRIVS